MKSKTENAVELFRGGMNCAQSVVIAFSDDLTFDREMAARISCGFGGGMGRLQETCGAATGSFMVLGIHVCRKHFNNRDRKEETYAGIQKFSERFKSIYGVLDCKSLLNCDLRTEEGQRYIKENNLHEVICEKCISDSVRIVEELIEN